MKKVIVFLMCVLAVSSARAYDECTTVGGTEITRNVNGAANAPSSCTPEKCPATDKKFCRSDKNMNWWTAFNWCASISGSLAHLKEMCPGVPTAVNNVADACPGLQGHDLLWLWSSVGYDSSSALIVQSSSGAISSYPRHGSSNYARALCE